MKIIKLSKANFDKVYYIDEIQIKDKVVKEKIMSMGIVKNQKASVLNCNYGKTSFLIKVMNVNYVIDKKICDEIYVRDE